MAGDKTKKSFAALCHVLMYALPFLFFRPSWAALAVIVVTHFAIDRWRLARYVVWVKNMMAPRETVSLVQSPNTAETQGAGGTFNEYKVTVWRQPWRNCSATGYPAEKPDYFAWWLLIIADNVMHVVCNGLALKFL
jgi:hypothetical protein